MEALILSFAVSCFIYCFYFWTLKTKWYREMLRQLDIKGRVFLYTILGGCELCFCHFISFLFIPICYYLTKDILLCFAYQYGTTVLALKLLKK